VEVGDFPFYRQPQFLDINIHAPIHDLHVKLILQKMTTIW
jgi:hypothetical protein